MRHARGLRRSDARPRDRAPARAPLEQLELDMRPIRKPTQRIKSTSPVTPDPLMDMDRLLRATDVVRVTGKHRTTIYRWEIAGLFPPPIRKAGRVIGWRKSDIERWLAVDADGP